MKETFYLFKRAADGVWIFGNNVDCEHQAGVCKPVPSTDRTKVSIIYFQKNDATPNIYDIPVVNFLDEAGVAYADFAALKAAYAGFFFSVAGSGSGKLPESVVMAGVLDQVDYELTGKVVDTSAFYYAIVDQVIMSKGAELSIESGVNSIATFTTAPNDGATIIFVFYTV